MRVSRVALALVSLLCFAAARDARAQTEELENAPAPPMPAPCPVVDSLGASTLHVFEFPALKTSLFDAEHVAPDGSRRPGREGVDLLVELNEEARTTLVLVTHDPELAARAHRVIRLAGGRIVSDERRRAP